jgi:UDP-N-acetylmuramate--alanine ligase
MTGTLKALENQRVHLLGIGGIGVSALARMLVANGISVSGCDVRESTLTRALREEGIDVAIGHSPDHVADNDIIVYSTAVPDDNAELVAAKASGKPVLHRSHILGQLVGAHRTIGVTGTNGKGTVCTMITWILQQAGLDPAFYIGGLSPNLGTNARETGAQFMVAELDESDGSLLNTQPQFALINNVELDHLNYYSSIDEVVDTLTRFCLNLPPDNRVFVNGDDDGAQRVARALPTASVVTFGQTAQCDFRYEILDLADDRSRFQAWHGEKCLGEFALTVPGSYNIENAIGAIAVVTTLGVAPEVVAKALATFKGLANRYTLIRGGGRSFIKDYMSHPSGMRKVLKTALLGRPNRLIAVFKPYRYTMIRYHAQNYADALKSADEVIITDMWEGGEEPIPGVDTSWLVQQLRDGGVNVTHIPDMTAIPDYLEREGTTGDCVVFFGGNDLFELAEALCARLNGGPRA